MIILGVDPGTAVTGYGVIDAGPGPKVRLIECGVVRTPARDPLPVRLRAIRDGMVELLERHRPGAVAAIFDPLAAASINVDMIIQNVAKDKGETDVTFTVPAADLLRAQTLLEERQEAIGFYRLIAEDGLTLGHHQRRAAC